jgi:hypothetical protein
MLGTVSKTQLGRIVSSYLMEAGDGGRTRVSGPSGGV